MLSSVAVVQLLSFERHRSLAHTRSIAFQHRSFPLLVGRKRKRRLSDHGGPCAKRARTDQKWRGTCLLSNFGNLSPRLVVPPQFGPSEPTILESTLADMREEAARMGFVYPTAKWEDEEIASTTETSTDDCEITACHTVPPIQDSGTSKVVLRRARRLYGRLYQEGEEVEVRRSRRLALKPRVSYVGMC